MTTVYLINKTNFSYDVDSAEQSINRLHFYLIISDAR